MLNANPESPSLDRTSVSPAGCVSLATLYSTASASSLARTSTGLQSMAACVLDDFCRFFFLLFLLEGVGTASSPVSDVLFASLVSCCPFRGSSPFCLFKFSPLLLLPPLLFLVNLKKKKTPRSILTVTVLTKYFLNSLYNIENVLSNFLWC